MTFCRLTKHSLLRILYILDYCIHKYYSIIHNAVSHLSTARSNGGGGLNAIIAGVALERTPCSLCEINIYYKLNIARIKTTDKTVFN